MITRKLDPLDPVVITFGKINGGNAYNVLAEKVNLIGTVRCTNVELFKNIGNWLNENISSLAKSFGADAKVIFKKLLHQLIIIQKLIESSEIRELVFWVRKMLLNCKNHH